MKIVNELTLSFLISLAQQKVNQMVLLGVNGQYTFNCRIIFTLILNSQQFKNSLQNLYLFLS